MDQKVATALDMDLSPYQVFTEREWARLRADTPMTLDAHEVAQLQGLNAPVSIEQVETIYLPLSRLLAFYAEATISIFQATQNFLGTRDGKTPFVEQRFGESSLKDFEPGSSPHITQGIDNKGIRPLGHRLGVFGKFWVLGMGSGQIRNIVDRNPDRPPLCWKLLQRLIVLTATCHCFSFLKQVRRRWFKFIWGTSGQKCGNCQNGREGAKHGLRYSVWNGLERGNTGISGCGVTGN